METRKKIYEDALVKWGRHNQLTVAIEELSELQKEICKYFRQEGKHEDLIEEAADVSIMLEQIILMFDIEDEVKKVMESKLQRLKGRIEG